MWPSDRTEKIDHISASWSQHVDPSILEGKYVRARDESDRVVWVWHDVLLS